ncbi:N-6 DNA methylase [Pediococcus claussenii]|uniref:N-6 DNA methylase n=1 Tax=Pediococcus claussenii TaxID=187452 RepID=UPI00081A2EAD|nr:N-6 DNA methylase [Pediococcus claussenii]ANZ70542.1 hypothetical protein AYR57_08485 [Pediococcus claussenii]ANZ72357.1 hypothetical protein AYR58_08485 [Pediococcus claussenii]
MPKISRKDFYDIAGVSQHAEFEKYLKDVLFDKEKREKLYRRLLDVDCNVYEDTFKSYFEEYAAERKSNMQDYTPDSVSGLLATITRSNFKQEDGWSGYDPTAGTGSLIIQKWKDDQLAETPWSYAPHNYLYEADEFADNVIPYLLHNLAIRGMNCIVIHGDTLTKEAKQIYFVQNSKDDFLGFSDINVMPHSKQIAKEFNITKWLEEPIEHVESGIVQFNPTEVPPRRKAMTVDHSFKPSFDAEVGKDQLRLGDVAEVERAKKKRIYPKSSIVIQMSATRGQIGLLKSSGEVGGQYAVVLPTPLADMNFLWNILKLKAPKWFRKVQEGLNLKLEDIQQIPIALTFAEKEVVYEQMSLF